MFIEVSTHVPADKESVWQAITDPTQMREWYFDNIPDFKPEVGFTTKFPVQSDKRTFTHLWTVTKVVPLQELRYRWRYREYPGEAEAVFHLLTEGEHTQLILRFTGLDTFPSGIPEFTEAACRGGWKYFLQEQLPAYLVG
jgi:uncharacterized protein YndB with AHSA1/START domain